MKIDVFTRLLAKNDATADDIRERLAGHGVILFNVMGSPGCGKTALLENLLPSLSSYYRCAALVGDLATTKDAERIARLGIPAAQLLTEGGCHLEARLVSGALDALPLDELDCVFVENVGNLVCPANFDLGEHARISVLSVAEGEDKPSKYPFMFQRSQAVVITKCDLLPMCRYDLQLVLGDLARIAPNAGVFETSCYRQAGLRGLTEWMHRFVESQRGGLRRRRPEALSV